MFSNILHLLLRAVQRYGTLIALGSTSCVSWVSDDPDQSYLRAPLFSRGTGKFTDYCQHDTGNSKLTESVATPDRLGLSGAGRLADIEEPQLVV